MAGEGHRRQDMSIAISVQKQRAGVDASRSPRKIASPDAHKCVCARAAKKGGAEAEPGGSGEGSKGDDGVGRRFYEVVCCWSIFVLLS